MMTILKDNFVFLMFFAGLALTHYGLYDLFPNMYFGDEIILSYAVLFILNSVGATIFYLGSNGPNKIDFGHLYLLFTTIQMLGCFSFAAFVKISYEQNAKPALIQFVTLFLLSLIFQTIYLVKTKVKEA